MDTVFFTIGCFVFLAGSYVDFKPSSEMWMHGMHEMYVIHRDKYKRFVPKYYLISTAIFFGVGVLCFVLLNGYAAGGLLLLVVAVRFFTGLGNKRKMGKKRVEQERWLTVLRENTGFFPYTPLDELNDIFGQLGGFFTRHDRSFYPLFPWVYSTQTSVLAAQVEVARKLIELSKGPQDKWFTV